MHMYLRTNNTIIKKVFLDKLIKLDVKMTQIYKIIIKEIRI